MRDVVVVLHADDFADFSRLRDLRRRHVAEPEMFHEAPPLKLGERSHLRLDRTLDRPMNAVGAIVDDFEGVQAKIAEVVVDRLGQLFPRESARSQEASATRRAPTLVTRTRSAG